MMDIYNTLLPLSSSAIYNYFNIFLVKNQINQLFVNKKRKWGENAILVSICKRKNYLEGRMIDERWAANKLKKGGLIKIIGHTYEGSCMGGSLKAENAFFHPCGKRVSFFIRNLDIF
jgi:hypothetical protein